MKIEDIKIGDIALTKNGQIFKVDYISNGWVASIHVDHQGVEVGAEEIECVGIFVRQGMMIEPQRENIEVKLNDLFR